MKKTGESILGRGQPELRVEVTECHHVFRELEALGENV